MIAKSLVKAIMVSAVALTTIACYMVVPRLLAGTDGGAGRTRSAGAGTAERRRA